MKIAVIFYSTYGHMYEMAKAAAKGAAEAGADVDIYRIPELLPDEIIAKMGALEARSQWWDLPEITAEKMKDYDGFIFGVPTKFGQMASQVKAFLDTAGGLWASDALVGKPAGVMTSTASQHGGQEASLLGMHVSLLHLGMVIVGLPYSYKGQLSLDAIVGGTPYGATTITAADGSRLPSQNELSAAEYQGAHLAQISQKLSA